MPRNTTQIALSSLICAGFISGSLAAQTGHVLNGEGPVNQSMAGVATATPLDASGALLWNSATITALKGNSIQFGMEMLKPSIDLSSAMPTAGGLMSDTTSSDSAVSPIPSFSLVYHIPDSDLTFGMNAVGVSGFGVNYPASSTNPLLMAPPNGFGSVYSNFQMLQLSPTIAYKVNKNWSVGFAPNIDQASLAINPGCFAAPNDPDGTFGNGDEVYPSGLNAATSWGFGAQAGVFYQGTGDWDFGASYKSQQVFNDFEFNSTDAAGAFRQLKLDMDFPAIASIGLSYRGVDKMVIGLDARYIDYKNTDGFDPAGFGSDGSVTGFGWDSIIVVALGAQYEVDECLSVRAGYAFNENPISDENSTFNVPAPAIIQQHASVGMSYCVGNDWFFDIAYQHGFENSIEGEMGHPLMGFIPGSSVENTMSTDSLIIGFRVLF
jgi:long-chain fatty acid transport protein